MTHHIPESLNKIKYVFVLIVFFSCTQMQAQNITLKGSITDTSQVTTLKGAIVMVTRLTDSLLVKYTRTAADGSFMMNNLPVDTYQVIISYPGFGDQNMILLGNKDQTEIDFKKIALPPKTIALKELTIYGYSDPVYFKGDTLIYTADSFKVKQNAVVEDLLKKLPGITVDDNGKITAQGKEVQQVLVDGDEFFGSDPTMATKNLAANTVESVQVYDKKDETATTDGETIKVMNLQLKDEAKKGYFGKISAGSDFNKFHEGEFLFNKFSGKQKISVFALGSNTPNSRFDWSDMYEYGLDNEYDQFSDEDGFNYQYWSDNKPQGIPITYKAGFYYNDQLSKKTKITLNYNFSPTKLNAVSSTVTQYFLSDTTYTTNNESESDKDNKKHTVNLTLKHKLDSLTDIEFTAGIKLNQTITENSSVTEFRPANAGTSRLTDTRQDNDADGKNISSSIKMNKEFDKKDRNLNVRLSYSGNMDEATGTLKYKNIYYDNILPDDSINQQKKSDADKKSYSVSTSWTEPLSKRLKLEINYNADVSDFTQNKKTYDYINGSYSSENSFYTNSFNNKKTIQRMGLKLRYEYKKHNLTIGSRYRIADSKNTNLVSGISLSQKVNRVIPSVTYFYKFSDNQNIFVRYNAQSTQPEINQLQPIADNSNPNSIYIGNIDLLPDYSHNFNLNFNSFKPISGKNIWAGMNFSTVSNAFTNKTIYDSLGRSVTQTVNVDGNYSGGIYAGSSLPFFGRILEISPSANGNFSHTNNFINGIANASDQFSPNGNLSLTYNKDTFSISIYGGYSYNSSSSSITTLSNNNYSQYNYGAGIEFEWKKFRLETNVNYNTNTDRPDGYNLDYILLNASLEKRLGKNENLILSINGTDLLDENINTYRDVTDNRISDIKTTIIGRFILFKVTYKFKNKTKTNEETP